MDKKEQPLLIDLDGVLRIEGSPADGIREFLDYIKNSTYKPCVISNSTHSSAADIKHFFERHSINIDFPLMTAADAALNYVKENYGNVSVYALENVKKLFAEFEDESKACEAVIIGDMGKEWTFDILNEIFLKVRDGADLIAMQKNKFWRTPENELVMDAGAFVTAVEFAASVESVLIGKPSPYYFISALKTLGFEKDDEFYMIGDDLETDIKGAQELNGRGILIYTGKTKKSDLQNSSVKPEYEIQNLSEAVDLLGGL